MLGPGSCPVQLRDGRTVDSWSPEWRDECAELEQQAHRIALLPRFDQRQAAVAAQERQHGALWAERLKNRLAQLRQARIDKERKAA
jgi:hypothetical protein